LYASYIIILLFEVPVKSLLNISGTMSGGSFGTLPHRVAPNVHIEPFRTRVSDSEIYRLQLLLDNSMIADANWENSQEDGRFGTTRDWLANAVQH
jgi:hypothetical protein